MNSLRNLFLLVSIAILTTGCSSMAPQYSASLGNVQALKNAGSYTAKVGVFTSGDGKDNPNLLSVRANSLSSPYNDSFSNYLAEAIKQELSLANKLAPDAAVEVSGNLVKNKLDASGFAVGSGEIEARFIVKKDNQIRYDQVKAVRHEWPSAFAGVVAIPRAIQEYPNLVQKLLAVLYADNEFLNALK